MKAWLITWRWIGDHAAVDDPVVAILSARTSAEDVRKYVERLYIEKYASLEEKLSYARFNHPEKPAYPAEYSIVQGIRLHGEILCGHNPSLYARLVDDLRVETDEDGHDVLECTELNMRLPPA